MFPFTQPSTEQRDFHTESIRTILTNDPTVNRTFAIDDLVVPLDGRFAHIVLKTISGEYNGLINVSAGPRTDAFPVEISSLYHVNDYMVAWTHMIAMEEEACNGVLTFLMWRALNDNRQ